MAESALGTVGPRLSPEFDSPPLSKIECHVVICRRGGPNNIAVWLPLEEVATHLKIGKSSLYQLAREGGIPAYKYGRV